MILLIAASGLFDFDLTFPTEGLLFLFLSFIISSNFLSPISKQMEDRNQYIDYNLRKSIIVLNLGYENLGFCLNLLTSEVDEMSRQLRLIKLKTSLEFENEISEIQKKNSILLGELKGDLSVKSAYLFANIENSISNLTDTFFQKKFKKL